MYESQEYALLAEIDGQDLDGLVFCSKAYALFEAVRNGPDGISRLRMLRGTLVGRLIEEVLPMCRYIQEHYRAGRYLSVKWFSGSQSFDALITQRGAMVDQLELPSQFYVEVTGAMHPNEYLNREHLEQEGYSYGLDGLTRVVVDGVKKVESVPVSWSGTSHVDQFEGFLSEAIRKKTQKVPGYPDGSVLIVYCALSGIFMADEWQLLMDKVRPNVDLGPFREIYVYDMATHRDRLFTRNWIGNTAV